MYNSRVVTLDVLTVVGHARCLNSRVVTLDVLRVCTSKNHDGVG